jgi:hypothetical protein
VLPGDRPLALIDVDGVLNPYAAAACPPGYAEHDLFPGDVEPVRVCPDHGRLLGRLTARFDLVWATSWEDEANILLAPLIGLAPLPVIRCRVPGVGYHEKLPAIAAAVAERPLVWFDDLHSVTATAWAAGRAAPTALIHVDPAVGLTDEHVDHALDLAAGWS